jgi:hypothetical protein
MISTLFPVLYPGQASLPDGSRFAFAQAEPLADLRRYRHLTFAGDGGAVRHLPYLPSLL